MLFSKTLLVLLVAILGTSWLPDGRTNGLASAWCWPTKLRIHCEKIKDPIETTPKVSKEKLEGGTTKVSTINDIPEEDDEFAPQTNGIWVADKYYKLPEAPYYKVEMKEGTARSFVHVPNPYYRRGPIIIKD